MLTRFVKAQSFSRGCIFCLAHSSWILDLYRHFSKWMFKIHTCRLHKLKLQVLVVKWWVERPIRRNMKISLNWHLSWSFEKSLRSEKVTFFCCTDWAYRLIISMIFLAEYEFVSENCGWFLPTSADHYNLFMYQLSSHSLLTGWWCLHAHTLWTLHQTICSCVVDLRG